MIEIRAHDHVAQDAIGVPHPAVELGERAIAVEHEEVVVAFSELLDGVCEPAAPPGFLIGELCAGAFGDALEVSDQRRRFFLRNLWRKNEQDFVSPHTSSFWPSGIPPRGIQGAGKL